MKKAKSKQRNPEEKKTVDYYFLQAQDTLDIVKALEKSANDGNPVSQLMYGLYHACAGTNIPAQRDVSYAEALKWLYKVRHNYLVLSVINGMLITVPGFNKPLDLHDVNDRREGTTLSDSDVAKLLSIPIDVLKIDDEAIFTLKQNGIYTIGALVLNNKPIPLNYRSAETVMSVVNHIKPYITIPDTACRFILDDNAKCASAAQQADPQ